MNEQSSTVILIEDEAPIRRFLRTFQPRLGLIIDTEIWPNCIVQCEQAGVPLVLANARLSEKSLLLSPVPRMSGKT
jgi:3-deoxy-D-manno-octulosonic-acid transferase